MRSVLGIDAAWTATEPSGVALAEETASGRWRVVAAETSYGRFRALAEGRVGQQKPIGEKPDAAALLDACRRLVGREPDLIAVDMPLSRLRITGRRVSDNIISSAYGAKKCAVHSPSATRPGPISDNLRADLGCRGYHLWTATRGPAPGLIEVYPHPALVELTAASERLKYKVGKMGQYWKTHAPALRREALFKVWEQIVAALEGEMDGVRAALPESMKSKKGAPLKAYEDAFDAVVCAWVALSALEGRAKAFGDADSAVWVPLPRIAPSVTAAIA
jgi:predicted RNase H-like nuclease